MTLHLRFAPLLKEAHYQKLFPVGQAEYLIPHCKSGPKPSSDLGRELYSFAVSFSTCITEFFYSDHSIDLSLSTVNLFKAILAYDWALYDTLNGVSVIAVILEERLPMRSDR